MKKSLKKIVMCMFFLSLSTCANKNSKILYVGTNAEFPPFEYLNGNEIVGFDVELIQLLANQLNMQVKIENMNWDGLLPALQGKKIDVIISGMTITPDRMKFVNFTDSYYISKEQMIILSEEKTNISTINDLRDKKVGVVLGYTGDSILTSIMDSTYLERFSSPYQAILALQSKKIEAVFLDEELAQNFSRQTPGLQLISGNNTSENYAIALRKEDIKLLEQLNEALSDIKKNGLYDILYKKYFPS